jgi:3-phenylpropionate/trans-cinnamate dioxygenase ferredoxin reductase subunit
VRLVLNARLTEFFASASGRIGGVRCADGTEHAADLVVVGIGVLPEDELAQRAGLDCNNGIVIDSFCRTSDPAVYAIGDCSNFASAHYGARLRLESVDNAFEQANTAALDIVGSPVAHDKVPWFWSDQYEHKMLIVGISQGHDQLVVRGDARGPTFSACYLRGGELIAIDTINNAKDQMAARKLIAAHARPDPLKLADPSIPLKDC